MNIDFKKYADSLVPAIVQNYDTQQVLMLGFMNEEALKITEEKGLVTFFSRSRSKIWTKGEESGNYLHVKEIISDCDNDTLLIKALPGGPVCHTGQYSCFEEKSPKSFLYELQRVIDNRVENGPENSYVRKLNNKGLNKIAQKFGEESVELIIESKDDNEELFVNEAADMLFHFIILLRKKGLSLLEIEKVLLERHTKSTS